MVVVIVVSGGDCKVSDGDCNGGDNEVECDCGNDAECDGDDTCDDCEADISDTGGGVNGDAIDAVWR